MSALKNWARKKDGANLPLWTAYFDYAEQFGIDPQEVPNVVTIKTWMRWLSYGKAQASRQLWDAWQSGHLKQPTKEQEALRIWAMIPED